MSETDPSPKPGDAPPRTPSPPARALIGRSLGAKFLLVCALALAMAIPALLVFGLIYDRSSRAEAAIAEIGDLRGGPQGLIGPVLSVPYERVRLIETADAGGRVQRQTGRYLIYPTHGEAVLEAKAETLSRGIHSAAVFRVGAALSADFDLSEARAGADPGLTLDWSRAEILVGLTNLRALTSEATLAAPGGDRAFEPAGEDYAMTRSWEGRGHQWMRAPLPLSETAPAAFSVSADLAFTGARELMVGAFAKNTEVSMTSDWPHPSFDGGYLPTTREVSDDGFAAGWSVPFLARGLAAYGPAEEVFAFEDKVVGARFIDPSDPYQRVTRALKYALMFVGVVFLGFFLFETACRRRFHPAQYVLVGLMQIVFYLLLLSFSELVGFDIAFLIGAAAVVASTAAYAGAAFGGRKRALLAFGVFASLYGLIYALMRLQDYALLVGAVTSFVVLAGLMWATRRIDWYGGEETAQAG